MDFLSFLKQYLTNGANPSVPEAPPEFQPQDPDTNPALLRAVAGLRKQNKRIPGNIHLNEMRMQDPQVHGGRAGEDAHVRYDKPRQVNVHPRVAAILSNRGISELLGHELAHTEQFETIPQNVLNQQMRIPYEQRPFEIQAEQVTQKYRHPSRPTPEQLDFMREIARGLSGIGQMIPRK